jgi:hypothetical protein
MADTQKETDKAATDAQQEASKGTDKANQSTGQKK